MKKEERGKYAAVFDRASEIAIVRWHDNSVVSIGTNHDAILPTVPARRWSKAAKKAIAVQQPMVIRSYNEGMGGVDVHDQLKSAYRISMGGKKW